MENNLKKLEQTIGYQFTAKSLLEQAMTHSSYANEKHLGKLGCNERLEFLGDAVLELISSDFLYKKFRNNQEGELTKKRASMVCEKSLAYCAREFGLPEFILLGLSSGVGYTLQIVGQKGMNPTVASLIMSLESVISAIAGWLVLGQHLSGREIAGCVVMFAAIILAQLPSKTAK